MEHINIYTSKIIDEWNSEIYKLDINKKNLTKTCYRQVKKILNTYYQNKLNLII